MRESEKGQKLKSQSPERAGTAAKIVKKKRRKLLYSFFKL